MKIAPPLAVRNRLLEYSKRPVETTRGDLGAVVGEFNRALEDTYSVPAETDTSRYIVWGFCFTPDDQPFQMLRSKDLTDGQIFALKKWIGFYKTEEEWTHRPTFRMDARGVFNAGNAIAFVERVGEPIPIKDYLNSLSTTLIEIEDQGMIESVVVDLGGTIQTYQPNTEPPATYEPDGGYIPL